MFNLNTIVSWAAVRLSEKSTWVGIVTAGAALVHMALTPGQTDAISVALAAIAGVACVFVSENKA